MPAAALPASEVRKNLRRDHRLIAPPKLVRVNIQQPTFEIRNSKFEKQKRDVVGAQQAKFLESGSFVYPEFRLPTC
jgi:hypothetical protein